MYTINKYLLKREDLWSKWKNDGCQPFKKPAPNSLNVESASKSDNQISTGDGLSQPDGEFPSLQSAKPRELGDILEEADNINRFELGK